MPTGILKRWLGDKGFGFITPDDGSSDLFAHIRQKLGLPEETIGEGRRVTFESEIDLQKGKPKAISWAFLDGAMAGMPDPATPALMDYKATADGLPPSLQGLSGGQLGGGGGVAPMHVPPPAAAVAATVPPPPPPAPIKHAQEEVEVPAKLVAELFGQAGAGLEDIKQRAGGDIMIELAASDTGNGSRLLKIRGPAVSASLGACLVLQRVCEVV
mmetsp:Transcript_26109/g.59363  ORF Transcript_26109/g.59363 Transcript_26109/m.59363 type:complete len:214 (-) Transcript_26109:144-785(-)